MRYVRISRRPDCIVAPQAEVARARSKIGDVVAGSVLLAILAAVPFLVANWSELTSVMRTKAAEIPQLQAARQQEASSGSESLLLVVTDESDRISSLALLAAVDDQPGLLAVVPGALFELLPGYGDFAVADAVRFEGAELARLAVSNALAVRIDRVAAIDNSRLAAALPNPVSVELPEPVVITEGDQPMELADAGRRAYDGTLIARLMSDRAGSSQVAWLERQAALWRALLDEAGADPNFAARLLGPGHAASVLGRVAASAPTVSVVPVTPVAVAGGEDGFQLAQADAIAFVADRMRHLALAAELRPRIEVLNGNGEILATRSVVEALVAAGMHVVKTDNAEHFDFPNTIVIAQGRDSRGAAEAAASILGVRQVQLEVAAPSGVVDVSIIVGHDIATLRS